MEMNGLFWKNDFFEVLAEIVVPGFRNEGGFEHV